MARHILLVHSKPSKNESDEYNEWYDEVHLPDVLAVDGFTAARRFSAAPSVHGELPDLPYLAIYEIDTDDLSNALAALSSAARTMYMSPAFDRGSQQVYAFTEIAVAPRADRGGGVAPSPDRTSDNR